MSEFFFTSDTHFFHKKILEMTARGATWATVEEMNEGLVTAWNETVRPQDIVYHLGDVTFGKPDESIALLSKLHGQKHWIRGNHDSVMDKVVRDAPNIAVTYRPYHELKIQGQHIVLFHFPILSWHRAHHGAWHLHGHCHGNLAERNGPRLDVGVDNIDGFTPISLEQLGPEMQELGAWKPVDQHGSVGEP